MGLVGRLFLEYEGESLVSASSSEGKVIWYDYDLEGNLKAVRDKEGTLSSYEYDDHDRLIAIFNAHGNRVFKADFDSENCVQESLIGRANGFLCI